MLRIAKVLKSNGTDGGILIGMRDITVDQIDTKEPVFIEFDGLPVPFFFDDLTPRGKDKAIAHITDVSTLEDSEEIVGRFLLADYFEEEEDDEEDFTGWTVYDRGQRIGIVSGFEAIPGNPCLCIGETLIPLHEDFVESIDEEAEELHLILPDGLI